MQTTPLSALQQLRQLHQRQQTPEAQQTQELKQAIRQIRYEISLAAEAPDSLQRLPTLYNQLAALYSGHEYTGHEYTGHERSQKTEHPDFASSH